MSDSIKTPRTSERCSRRADGSEEICTAAYLAGCDGAHSTVREALAIGFPGGTYEGLFYVADVEASGPATNLEIHVDLDMADLLLVFPMKGTGCVRLVGSVREEPGVGDRELTFDDVRSRAIDHLNLTIAKVNWFSTYRVHHRVAHSFRKGRAYLLGDAAHIHSPVGGQGMNTGIGDAVNLAWKLAAVLDGEATDGLLDTYELERIGFARGSSPQPIASLPWRRRQGASHDWSAPRSSPGSCPCCFVAPRCASSSFGLFHRSVSSIAIARSARVLPAPSGAVIASPG